jgi:hypothetical protein
MFGWCVIFDGRASLLLFPSEGAQYLPSLLERFSSSLNLRFSDGGAVIETECSEIWSAFASLGDLISPSSFCSRGRFSSCRLISLWGAYMRSIDQNPIATKVAINFHGIIIAHVMEPSNFICALDRRGQLFFLKRPFPKLHLRGLRLPP